MAAENNSALVSHAIDPDPDDDLLEGMEFENLILTDNPGVVFLTKKFESGLKSLLDSMIAKLATQYTSLSDSMDAKLATQHSLYVEAQTEILKAQNIPSEGKVVAVSNAACMRILKAIFGHDMEVLPSDKDKKRERLRTSV